MIPFVVSLRPDELLYSYSQRLAIKNGLSQALFETAYAVNPSAKTTPR